MKLQRQSLLNEKGHRLRRAFVRLHPAARRKSREYPWREEHGLETGLKHSCARHFLAAHRAGSPDRVLRQDRHFEVLDPYKARQTPERTTTAHHSSRSAPHRYRHAIAQSPQQDGARQVLSLQR